MKKGISIFFGIWCLLFIISALVQLNDADAWIWVMIYLVAATLSGFAATNRFPVAILAVVAFLSLLGSIYYFPPSVGEWVAQEWEQQDLTMKTLAMEEARESFGLLLISVVMGIAAYVGWRAKNRRRPIRN